MLYTAALLSAAMLLAGCYSTDTDDDLLSTATLISIYPSTVSVGSAAATQNVVVTLAPKSKRNLDWSCSVQSAWVTAVREKVPGESTGTVYEDAVVLAFLENTAYKRQTTLTITASDGTVLEVPVVQKGIYADAYVKAAPESLTFMAENPQPAAVAIDTNMDTFAAVSDSDWCTVVDNGDGTITVTCTEYGDNTADRTAEITVTAGTPDTSEARTVIPVTQLRKDVYCYLYGSGVPKYPTREKWGQMTKLSDRVYVDSVYVKNGRFSVYTTEGDTYHLDGAGNLSAAETDLTVDVAGLRIVMVAEKVGVGAVIFGALYNNKIKDIVFSYDKVLNFEGETSVYVQYTCARANSVLQKGGLPETYEIPELAASEFELVKAIAAFPEVVKDAAEKYEPSFIARFAVETAQKFNKFYFDCKILGAEDERTKNFRLALTAAALQALKNAFTLLGIGIPDKM